MKLLIVGDLHGDAIGPSRRTDDYPEMFFSKLEQIGEIARTEGVRAVLLTGDLTDRIGPRVPHGLVVRMIDALRAWGTVYSALGNHDIWGTNIASWEQQPIGVLVRAGVVRPLWVDPVHISDESGPGVWVSSRPYCDEADEPSERAATYGVQRSGAGEVHIRVTHTMLTPTGYPVAHTTPGDLLGAVAPTNRADLYVAGHIHDCLGTFSATDQYGTVRCVNYGSVMRGSIAEADVRRIPTVGVVEVREGRIESVRPVKLHCQPAEQVFDLVVREQEVARDDRIQKLIDSFGVEQLADRFRLVDPVEAADAFLTAGQVVPAVRKRVQTYVEQARQAVG